MSVRFLGKNKKGEDTWQIDITMGRAARKKKSYVGTKEEAHLLELYLKKELGVKAVVRNTINDLVHDYLEYVRVNQAEKTYIEKRRMLYGKVLSFFGSMYFDFINKETIEAYKKKRVDSSNWTKNYKLERK